MEDQSEFAQQICDAMHRTTGGVVAVTDRDSVVACAGVSRRDLVERRISESLGKAMEERQLYRPSSAETSFPICEGDARHTVSAAAPILCGGDLLGCVLYAGRKVRRGRRGRMQALPGHGLFSGPLYGALTCQSSPAHGRGAFGAPAQGAAFLVRHA